MSVCRNIDALSTSEQQQCSFIFVWLVYNFTGNCLVYVKYLRYTSSVALEIYVLTFISSVLY
jgi:hypothetical protein